MKEEIFRAYDIRGDYPSQINEDFAYKLGKAVVLFLKTKKIIVGRDCREGSKELAQALINGIINVGADAIDMGLCSTPMVSFSSKNADSIMITASHLSAQKNGFKIFKKGVTPIGENNGLQQIKRIIQGNKLSEPNKKGEIKQSNVIDDYSKHVLKFAKKIKPIKIAVDAGNGMAGYVLPHIFNKLPCEVIKIYFELDGRFPNRNPNPQEKNALARLSETVKAQNANFGAAYDADCDRIVFVDERGEMVQPDLLLAVLAQTITSKKEKIIYESTCSKIVPEKIKEMNNVPMLSKVGHTFIQQAMQKNKAILGGERSGHYFFKQNYFADSGDIALMLILTLLSTTGKKLSELVAPLKKYSNTQEVFIAENKQTIIEKIKKEFSKGKITTIDGITIEFTDWWFNLRASNTEPEVKLTIEAKTKLRLEEKMKEVRILINQLIQQD